MTCTWLLLISSESVCKNVSEVILISFRWSAAPAKTPQSHHREDKREDCGHLEREDRPDPEVNSTGVGDPAADKSHSSHVSQRDDRAEDRAEQHDHVARATFGKHGGPKHPDNQHQHPTHVPETSRFELADDVVRDVKRHEEDREQRRDG